MESDRTEYYLGIEGGATRSTFVLADSCGRCVAELCGGPANLKLLSDKKLLWLLRSFAKRMPQCRLKGMAIGFAGARTETDRERIRSAAARVWAKVPCYATNDLETALAAAPTAKDADARVLVLSGTGSCCFGRSAAGKVARIGGRGHVVGDRGSACDISQRALKVVMAEYDHSGRWPKMGQLILEHLLFNDPEDLIPWSMEADKTSIAGLAVCVFEAARRRDPLAKQLLGDAAQALADDADACALRLSKRAGCTQFVLNGGVLLKNPGFAADVVRRIRRQWPNAVFTKVEGSSAWGALHLAMENTPVKTKPVKKPLQASFREDHPAFAPSVLRSSPTEQRNPRSINLDRMGLGEAVDLMLDEDLLIPEAIRRERAAIVWVIGKIVTAIQSGGRLFYVGAGSSGRLGVLDASECPPTFRSPAEQVQGIIAGGHRALWSAVEGAEDDESAGGAAVSHRGVHKRDVVIGIAASGRTPFVWGALAEAGRLGAVTVLVCFNPAVKKLSKKTSAFFPDKIIAPDLGPEILTGSTRLKSGTATKTLLNIFSTLALVRSGKVISNLMVDLNPSNAKLRERAIDIVKQLAGCSAEQARESLEESGWVIKDAWKNAMKASARP